MLQADYGPDIRAGIWAHNGYQGVTPARRQAAQRGPWEVLTSSRRRRCSFCSSMRFWRSASSCRLCSSFSLCCCSSCCRRRASDRSLLASCSLRKSRRRVDSPGRFRMELWAGERDQNSSWGKGNRYLGSWGELIGVQHLLVCGKRSHTLKNRPLGPPLIILLTPQKKQSQGER